MAISETKKSGRKSSQHVEQRSCFFSSHVFHSSERTGCVGMAQGESVGDSGMSRGMREEDERLAVISDSPRWQNPESDPSQGMQTCRRMPLKNARGEKGMPLPSPGHQHFVPCRHLHGRIAQCALAIPANPTSLHRTRTALSDRKTDHAERLARYARVQNGCTHHCTGTNRVLLRALGPPRIVLFHSLSLSDEWRLL